MEGTFEKARLMRVSNTLGTTVRNHLGDEVGIIKDLTIDIDTGRIGYAVLAVEKFLGLGEKLFAIPWGALSADREHDQFVLDVTAETLKQAPGFDKHNWPDMAMTEFADEVHSYYSVSPFGR